MTAKNDITGDSIRSRHSTSYSDNYDTIDWSAKVGTPKKPPVRLNVADLKDRLTFLDQEAFCYDKATNEFIGAAGVCPPPANVYVWVNGLGACPISDLTFDPELGIIIDIESD